MEDFGKRPDAEKAKERIASEARCVRNRLLADPNALREWWTRPEGGAKPLLGGSRVRFAGEESDRRRDGETAPLG